SLGEKREWQLVFLITERGRDLLKKRFVASVHVDFVAYPIAFLSQTELCCSVEHAGGPFFRQIFQRRLTATWTRQWHVCGKCLRQVRGIDAHLRHVAVRLCAREKRAVASLDKYVKHRRFEGWIGCVPVCFPAAIQQIDLDA